ncbi:PKD domain-containing protein [Flavobacterium tegetincola]|uniref:PKD domain-containing protein n=1 Tax=Flavobacterium tegetincola TaxID=150172 RepID=UPI000415028F|nr:PKD domain-containing protein [Flavobacterium tegetincola]
MKNNFFNRSKKFSLIVMLGLTFTLISCDDYFAYDLPEANSIADVILPTANYSYASLPGNFMLIKFTNLSSEATNFMWDFGQGQTSTLTDPTFEFTYGEGTYPVTLTASDANGELSTVTIDVVVEMGPVAPTILGPGFEVDADKNFWKAPFSRLGNATSVMQTTTSSGYFEGARGGKFPTNEDRLGYQELTTFTPNTNYVLKYKYRIKNTTTADGTMNVAIIKPITVWDLATLSASTLSSNAHVENATNSAALVEGTLQFNSGNNTTLAILLYNQLEEIYIDSFTLEIQ